MDKVAELEQRLTEQDSLIESLVRRLDELHTRVDRTSQGKVYRDTGKRKKYSKNRHN